MARGRPRQFNAEKALDAALMLFWRHGYEGTSLAALTTAMGINVPSLYAAFGNKETLFKKALDRYIQRPASYLPNALQEPTAVMNALVDALRAPLAADEMRWVETEVGAEEAGGPETTKHPR